MINAEVGSTEANSYVTLEEANAYFETSLHRDAWNELDNKEGALVTATNYLDSLKWNGYPTDSRQSLQLPRFYMYDKNSYYAPADEIHRDVKRATYEMALFLAENIDLIGTRDTTTRIRVAVIEIENELIDFGSFSSMPLQVRNLIRPFVKNGNGVNLTRYNDSTYTR